MALGELKDRDRWPEIQSATIDAMVRLERALGNWSQTRMAVN
jgi:hypothetical protein